MSSVSDRLDDFPDRFSPMLVKELRQGLRAKTFVVVFLVMQGLLGLILLAATASSDSASSGEVISKIVFVLYSLAVLVIQPLRGVASLSAEIRGDTIDLMVLTRLSSLRIVLGKWVAIVSQSALLASTIIPYLILRYYFGNMNLFAELMLVGMIFLISMSLTAITVGLSGCRSVFVRGILPILGSMMLAFSIFGIGFGREFAGLVNLFAFDRPDDFPIVMLAVVLISYLGWSSLSLGASLIAPHAENHSTLRRLVALVLTITGLAICSMTTADRNMLPAIWFLFAAPAIAIALAEPNQLVPSVCRSFTRRGLPGRIAGRFLYPGWPSAVGYTILLIAVGALFIPIFRRSEPVGSDAIAFMSLVGSLLLPGLLVVWAGKRLKDRAATFILLWIALALFTVALAATADAVSDSSFLWAFVWNPVTLLPMEGMSSYKDSELLLAGGIINIVYLTILLVLAFMAFRSIRALENKSAEE